jgi:hypothetical protein
MARMMMRNMSTSIGIVRLYDSLPDKRPEKLRGVARRKLCEAQFDDLECRDLLDAGGAEYCFCRGAFNFGVLAVMKKRLRLGSFPGQ